MVLSDNDIRTAIKRGDIAINPFTESAIKPGSYTFTLSDTLLLLESEGTIDTKADDLAYKEITIGAQGFVVQPGQLVLGMTKEKISISTKLCCLLDARTTLVRIGLNALQGSTFILTVTFKI